MRRVVVTGLGAITPLGVGIRRAWTKLLAGESGIVNTLGLQPTDRWKELPSTVAGLVPEGNGEGLWNATQWLGGDQVRHTSKFGQYAIAASEMALKDAGLEEVPEKDRRRTGVCLGSSVGSLNDVYDMSLAHHAGVRHPEFDIPSIY